jgi:GNAT superfamily N-acetyltransferase
MTEIRTLPESDLADVIRLYNRAIARNPFSGWLDESVWENVIAAKPYYSPEAVLVAYDGATPLGYAHLCNGPNSERTAPDPTVGSVEGLFFDPSRPDVGLELLQEAVRRHRKAGAGRVLGWSSFSGYPLYRGIFVGLEPMALEEDRHVVEAFLAAGFDYCQRSVEMAIDYNCPVEEPTPTIAVDFRAEPWSIERSWEAATWRGLRPYRNHATIGGEDVASCLYAVMPVISAKCGGLVGSIGGLRTAEAWRRKGIGSFLAARALNHMLELGVRRVTLGTQHDNWAAHATYRRLGMEIEASACAFALDFDATPSDGSELAAERQAPKVGETIDV